MIAHVVLFEPRGDLSEEARRDLVGALTRALADIPSIHRSRIGTRVLHGRPYESLMRVNYGYAAILEFEDVAGLEAYLEHPAHETLGAQFFAAFEEALMYDFELKEGADGVAAAWSSIAP